MDIISLVKDESCIQLALNYIFKVAHFLYSNNTIPAYQFQTAIIHSRDLRSVARAKRVNIVLGDAQRHPGLTLSALGNFYAAVPRS
jgi:hypothetical protein